MTWYNGKFDQCLNVIISANDHHDCLFASKYIKKQCEAWEFNVNFTEHKSARKGPVLKREIMINQTAYASDILIFKETVRRICFHLDLNLKNVEVKFIDRGSEPVNNLREQ